MAERYLSLGGTIETSSEVVDMNIRGEEVSSVTCKNGKTHEGNFFIAACDANVLYRGLLKGQYPDSAFEMRFNNPTDYPLSSNIYIGIGYEGIMEGIPRTLKFQVDSFQINEVPIKYLQMTHYGYEPDFAQKVIPPSPLPLISSNGTWIFGRSWTKTGRPTKRRRPG